MFSIDDVIAAAKTCMMQRVQPLPETTLEVLNQDHYPLYSQRDLWNCLAPYAMTAREQAAVRWKLTRLSGSLTWTRDSEVKDLEGFWRRVIVEPIGKISSHERDAYDREGFAKLAEARREAQEHARLRQLYEPRTER